MITLSTGTVVTVGGAGDDIVGIGADLVVSAGYDNNLEQWLPQDVLDVSDDDTAAMQLTGSEKIELCDIMIDRWSRLRGTIRK